MSVAQVGTQAAVVMPGAHRAPVATCRQQPKVTRGRESQQQALTLSPSARVKFLFE